MQGKSSSADPSVGQMNNSGEKLREGVVDEGLSTKHN